MIQSKTSNYNRIYNDLPEDVKDIINNIIKEIDFDESQDPFKIKKRIINFIQNGDLSDFDSLLKELSSSLNCISKKMINDLIIAFNKSNIVELWDEYTKLKKSQPQLDSEELMYIEEIISENIGKDITIIRDENDDNKIKLMLDDQDLVGLERKNMNLSTGEQNFVSLAFALLLARHSNKDIIILDDPISSFDSVYKNKIAFCIIKFLEKKNQIVMTHNLDCIERSKRGVSDAPSMYVDGLTGLR